MEQMENIKLQTLDELFAEISIGEVEEFPVSDEQYRDALQKADEDAIQERSRRAAAYREAAKIYLTF